MAKSTREVSSKLPRKRMVKVEEEKKVPISLVREGSAILLCFFSIFLFLSICSYISNIDIAKNTHEVSTNQNLMGIVGFYTARFLVEYLGYCSFSTVICVILVAGLILRQAKEESLLSAPRIICIGLFCLTLTLACAALASTFFGYDGGGYYGSSIAVRLDNLLNKAGTVLLSLAIIVISLAVLINLRLDHYFTGLKLLWAGTKTAARDTTIVLNAGVKVGNTALKKTGSLLKISNKQNKSNEFVLGEEEEEDEDFTLGDEAEDEDEYVLDDDHEDTRIQRKKGLRKSKRVLKTRHSKDVEEDEELEEDESDEEEEVDEDEDYQPFEDDEYDEDAEFDEDEDEEYDGEDDILDEEFEEVEEFAPLISREQRPVEKKAKRAITTSSSLQKSKEEKKTRNQLYADYQNPGRELLVGMEGVAVEGPDDEELLQNSRKLEVALRNFKLGGRVVEVHPGPIVTLYQFEPAAGIKVQRIINLADDLALALKVESVRVYAPVPGKGTVGIEVPNAEREVVRLRDIVDSEDFSTKPMSLALALGKDTYGQAFVADLAKMPHLLIAGATGTGKSVCINSLLMSLLYKNSPSDLRLILIDPKMLELSIYESIPHLLSPVVTNPKRARGVLYWAVEEMERRYEMMKEFGVRDMAMFNRMLGEEDKNDTLNKRIKKKEAIINLEEKDVLTTTAAQAMIDRNSSSEEVQTDVKGLEPLPRIVIVVDELADLMLTVGREIEELLTRLAQKARAAGIHLILATQRPSVNVITGLIKANFPARISFKVASKIDARTVMDQSGAERLLGQGDMLFLSPSVGRVKRLHSPFVSDQEVHDVVSWIRGQGEPDYDPRIEKTLKALEEQEIKNSMGEGETDFSEYDPLYDQAVNLVLEKGQASTSMVQRVFRIGYNRAARILEMMEKEGVVGPADGAKPRQVLINTLGQ